MDFKLPFKIKETVKVEKFEGSIKDTAQDHVPFETLVFEDGQLISKITKESSDGDCT